MFLKGIQRCFLLLNFHNHGQLCFNLFNFIIFVNGFNEVSAIRLPLGLQSS